MSLNEAALVALAFHQAAIRYFCYFCVGSVPVGFAP